MTTTAILIPWAAICGGYIRFRQAVRRQRQESSIIPESRSILQPYLAWYGLVWCIVLRIPPASPNANLIVIFQGYKVLARSNEFWSQFGQEWAFQFAPFAVILGFLLLFGSSYLIWGEWMFTLPRASKVDLSNGRARELDEEEATLPLWKKVLRLILNAI